MPHQWEPFDLAMLALIVGVFLAHELYHRVRKSPEPVDGVTPAWRVADALTALSGLCISIYGWHAESYAAFMGGLLVLMFGTELVTAIGRRRAARASHR